MRGDHHHQWHGPVAGALADQLRGRKAVQVRHAPVHQDHVERLSLPDRLINACQGLLPARHPLGLPAQRVGGAQQQFTGYRVVIGDQQAQVGVQGVAGRTQTGLLGHFQFDIEPEAAALADLALHPQLAAHQLDQALADHQAQAGTTETPGGRGLGLGEAVEDTGQLLGADADAGIAHRHAQGDALGIAPQLAQADHHLALLGELEGIAGQVDQHLLQPQAVTDQRAGQFGIQVEHHLDILLPLVAGQHHGQVAQQGLELEAMQVELQLAGLDLRIVEDVVEQAEQRLRRAVSLLHIVQLARIELGGLDQLKHAEHRVHRRADLVAHVGQEGALGRTGGVGLLLGLAQARLQFELGGDVAVDPGDLQRVALGIALDLGTGLDVQHLAIRPEDPEDRVIDRLTGHGGLQLGLGSLEILGVDPLTPVRVGQQPALAQSCRLVVELEHARIPVQAIVRQGPAPDAQLRDFGGQQQLVTYRQGLAAQRQLLGQIGDDADQAPPAGGLHGANGELDGEFATVAAQPPEFQDMLPPRPGILDVTLDQTGESRARLRCQKLVDVALQQRLGAVIERRQRRRIAAQNPPLLIEGEHRVDRRIEHRAGGFQALGQALLGGLALGDVERDAQVAEQLAIIIAHRGDHQGDREARAVLAHIGPLAGFHPLLLGHMHEGAKAFDALRIALAQLGAMRSDLLRQVDRRRRLLAHHFPGAVAEQTFGTTIEHGDQALRIGGDDRHLRGRVEHVAQQHIELVERPRALGHLPLQAGIELQDLRLGGLLRGNVAYRLRYADHRATLIANRRGGNGQVQPASVAV